MFYDQCFFSLNFHLLSKFQLTFWLLDRERQSRAKFFKVVP